MNCGLEHIFYVPIEYSSQFYKNIKDTGLDIFQIRSCGIPLAYPKNSSHWFVEAKLKCKELGLEPRRNLLEEHYK